MAKSTTGIAGPTYAGLDVSLKETAVCIVDDAGGIAGIITDGDLRRHMRPDLLTASVDDIMTRQPKTVPPSMLATEMIEVLNTRKITTLLVTEADKVVGIVHLHDLLRAGVA